MAFEGPQPVKLPGVKAGADLSAASTAYKFVKFSSTTSPSVGLCSATTDKACGVLQGPAPTSSTGVAVEVVSVGVTKVQTDGSVKVGDVVAPDASGRATIAAAGTFACGLCVDNNGSVGAAGDLITIDLRPAYAKTS